MHSPFVPGRSQRLKWWWEDLRGARFSWALSAVLLLIELMLSAQGGPLSAGLYPLYETFGLSRSGIAKGWVWQLATYGLLHGGWGHASLNVLCLVATGARVERIGGSRMAAKVFLLGVVVGAGVFLLFPSSVPLVGASGGVFALLLWLTTVSPQSRMAPVPLSARNLGLGILIASGILALIAPWVPMAGVPVSHACHFGGAMAGWWMARRILKVPASLADLKKERARRESANGLRREG